MSDQLLNPSPRATEAKHNMSITMPVITGENNRERFDQDIQLEAFTVH